MQKRIHVDRLRGFGSAEVWAEGQGWRLVNIARKGAAGMCSVANHEEIKRDLGRFRQLQLAGYQDAGGGCFAEMRVCPTLSCRSTIAIWVGADGKPCKEPRS